MTAHSPQIIAHRGNSSVAPENTPAAFAAAIAAGAGCIEIDVSVTGDDHFVVIHDETLDRTTNGTGAVGESSLAQVQSLDAGAWFSPAYAGQPVPRLEEFADLLSDHAGIEALVELKGRWSAANIARVVEGLTRRGVGERVILQSFHPHTLAMLHEHASHLRRGVLAADGVENLISACVAAGVYTLNPHVRHVEENPSLIGQIHAAGLRAQVWTANDPGRWRFLRELRVDGIITDRPDALAGYLAR